MKKLLSSCMAVLGFALASVHAATLCTGNSAPIYVDLTSGTRTAALSETIRYSTAWETSAAGATASVAVNGETLSSAAGNGATVWQPTRKGTYTLTHKVMNGGTQVGETLSATFVVLGPETPVISPEGGVVNGWPVSVSFACATEGATIHYTTDGSEPTAASPTGQIIQISECGTVKAVAVKNGVMGDVATAVIVSVKADAKGKTYGEPDPELTATVTGLVGTDTVTYTLARAEGEDAGTYAIMPSGATTQGKYIVIYETANLTISRKALTVAADAKSKVYGDADPELTATVTGLVGTDTVTYTLARAVGDGVGTYAITPFGAVTQGNYTIAYETATLTISPKVLMVVADAQRKVCGDADPELTFTVSGLVGADTLSGALTRAEGEDMGTYAITQGSLDAGDNYTIVYTGSNLTITVPETPVISPEGGVVSSWPVSVTMTCATEGAVIHYTTDGTEPTAESSNYRRFRISGRTTIKAVAIKNGLTSGVAVAEYALGQCPNPVVTAASTFTGSKTEVALSCSLVGAVIRYTLDGSTPDTESNVYASPFFVTESCAVKAVAFYPDYFDSAVSSFAIEKVWGIGDTMGDPDRAFTTEGDATFFRVTDTTAPFGEAMQSGAITHNQTSTMTTTVMGSGTVSFQWRTSCEDSGGAYDWDHAEFEVDGVVVSQLDGVTAWQTVSQTIVGNRVHTLVWRYVKDDVESEGDDCCRVADFLWTAASPVYTETQTTPEPIPYAWLRECFPAIVDESAAYEAAALAVAANGVNKVWECYVAGLSPTNAAERFEARVEFENGKPVVTWTPDLGAARDYVVEGKESLGGGWGPTNAASRFFRVKVKLP